jgi:hypothetical protein
MLYKSLLTFTISAISLIVNSAYACELHELEHKLEHKMLLWDNDGTIMASKDPNDTTKTAKVTLPGVKNTMMNADYNFVISDCKTPESEIKNFDPQKVAEKFTKLMDNLPISAVVFAPSIGGTTCYAVIKKDGKIVIKKAHEEPRYKKYICQFKKPEIGMFMVIQDIAKEEFGQIISESNSIMIGDTWHDEKAAEDFGIPFVDAEQIHKLGNIH